MTTEFKITGPGWYRQRNDGLVELAPVICTPDIYASRDGCFHWTSSGRFLPNEESCLDVVSRAEDWEPSEAQVELASTVAERYRAALKAAFPYGPPAQVSGSEHWRPSDERVAEDIYAAVTAVRDSAELEQHRAAHKMVKDAGWESPEELLAAHKHLSKTHLECGLGELHARIAELEAQLAKCSFPSCQLMPPRKGPFVVENPTGAMLVRDTIGEVQGLVKGWPDCTVKVYSYITTYRATTNVEEIPNE